MRRAGPLPRPPRATCSSHPPRAETTLDPTEVKLASKLKGANERRAPKDPPLASVVERPPRGPEGQPAVTGAGFSMGTPMRLPYSVHEPS
jgi:hypothetical protein